MTVVVTSEEGDLSNSNVSGNNVNNGEFVATVRKFESSYIRVPLEQFRRAFRQEMKIVEKDLPQLEQLLKKHLGGQSASASGPSEQVQRALEERILALKSRFEECRGECQRYRKRFVKRLGQIEEVCESGNYRNWSRERLLRLIGDFLIKSGDLASARKLIGAKRLRNAEDSSLISLEDSLDLELIEWREGILKSLREGCLDPAIQWCSEHRPNLKKLGSDLEFRLRQQEFIELLRKDDFQAALQSAQKHFPGLRDQNWRGVKESMGLLCWFPLLKLGQSCWNNGRMAKYEALISPANWLSLIDHFIDNFRQVYSIELGCQLVKIVETGLSVLKTRQCCQEGGDSVECPVCAGPLMEVAKDLPFGHYEITRLRCRITGALMNEDNPPTALPNGQVFSTTALQKLASESSDRQTVVCPITGDSFNIHEVRKCFFL